MPLITSKMQAILPSETCESIYSAMSCKNTQDHQIKGMESWDNFLSAFAISKTNLVIGIF
jgi:hypothetical protein